MCNEGLDSLKELSYIYIIISAIVCLLQEKFVTYLLTGTQRLTPEFALRNDDVISHIINCSTAIILLSETKCDIATNPNPKVGSLMPLKDSSRGYANNVAWFPSPVLV